MARKILVALALVFSSHCAAAIALAQTTAIKQPSFDSAGVPIHYLVTGNEDGEPVVLVHGFVGNIEVQWAGVIPALQNDFKVIALDCRGHGGSGKPHDPKQYGLEMVHDVARLLDHLKIDKAHIVGYSMGAGIALAFAIHHPERTRTATLGGGAGPDPDRQKLVAIVADSLEKGEGLAPLIIALTPKDRPPPTPAAIKLIDAGVQKFNDVEALAAVARGLLINQEAIPTEAQIAAIRVPLLAIIGADDPLRSGVDRLQRLVPAAKVVVIEKADHMTAFGRPEFVDGLKVFIKDNGGGK